MNKKETFREYLMEKCTNETHALDDMLPDVYEDWIAEQDVEDIIDWAEKWAKPTTPVDSKQTAKEHDDKIREEAVERVFDWLSEANYDCTVQELYEKYLKGLSGDKR